VKGVVGGALLLLVAMLVMQSVPDFQRYKQLRDM